ncbi:MAG: PDZ domain-containing protein [Pirellulales bacterium]
MDVKSPMMTTILSRRCVHPAALVLAGMIFLVPAARSQENPAAAAPSGRPPFDPGDISIGEPVVLPSTGPRTEQAAVPPGPVAPKNPPLGTLSAGRPGGVSPAPLGQGWLGFAVAESTVPGRWTVDEVAAAGPAAAAGIRAGDEVRAINGLPLRNADDVSEALTAIAPGQEVRLAIARGEQISDLAIVAVDRPPAITARTWQASPEPAAAAPPPFATAPPQFSQPLSPPRVDVPRVAATPATPPADLPLPAAAAIPSPLSRPPGAGPVAATGRTALGVRTVPIDADLQLRFNLPAATGAYVIGVVQDLPASKAGVPPGSVIVSLNDRPVRSPDELTQLVTAGPVGRPVTLQYVLPGGTAHRADVVLQSLERPLEEALVGPPLPVATAVPVLEPGPQPAIARRPTNAAVAEPGAIRAEIHDLRTRIDQLERRLEAVAR